MPWISKRKYKEILELEGRINRHDDRLRAMEAAQKIYTNRYHGTPIATNIVVGTILDYLGLELGKTPELKSRVVLTPIPKPAPMFPLKGPEGPSLGSGEAGLS